MAHDSLRSQTRIAFCDGLQGPETANGCPVLRRQPHHCEKFKRDHPVPTASHKHRTLVFLYFEVTGRPFTGHAPDTSFILEILPLNQVKALR